jgi:hypothetical protein
MLYYLQQAKEADHSLVKQRAESTAADRKPKSSCLKLAPSNGIKFHPTPNRASIATKAPRSQNFQPSSASSKPARKRKHEN